MSNIKTSIEWTDKTWGPTTGCDKVSPGCKHCYAETIAKRFWKDRKFTDVRLHPERLSDPLRWRKPSKIFVDSMSDLFHDVPFDYIAAVFGIMAVTARHTFQILTKRPARAVEFFEWLRNQSSTWKSQSPITEFCIHGAWKYGGMDAENLPCWNVPSWPLPNVWIGVSAEDQKRANERIPDLLRIPAAVRFVSAEPLLGPIDLNEREFICETWRRGITIGTYLDWVIVGGESGPGSRPCNVNWIRDIVRQCKAASVQVFVKQLGAWPYETDGWYGSTDPEGLKPLQLKFVGGKKVPPFLQLKNKKGGDPAEWPADLRVREMPR